MKGREITLAGTDRVMSLTGPERPGFFMCHDTIPDKERLSCGKKSKRHCFPKTSFTQDKKMGM
jgi:hypothetical protein